MTVMNGYACTGGRVTGEQRLNGQPKTKATLARVMGYVEQNDIHTPALTVVESLQFSAHLRLDRNVNKRQEHNFVNNVGFVRQRCPNQWLLLDLLSRSVYLWPFAFACLAGSLLEAGSVLRNLPGLYTQCSAPTARVLKGALQACTAGWEGGLGVHLPSATFGTAHQHSGHA